MGNDPVGSVRPGPARRPGRPVRLPEDDGPAGAGRMEPSARLAWLLVVSRLLHPDPSAVNRARFVRRLREQGVAADATRVSRWESGQQAASVRLLEAYELLLDLPPWSLVALHRGLARVSGTPPDRPGLTSDTASSAPATPSAAPGLTGDAAADPTLALEALIDRAVGAEQAEGGPLAGADWLRLADLLTGFEVVFLDRGAWATLCGRLLGEMARTTGVAEVLRYEAAATLAGHPVAGRHLLQALLAWVSDPDTQRLAPVMTLLAESQRPTGDELLSRLLSTTRADLRDAAEITAAVRLSRRLAGTAMQARLEQHVSSRVSSRGARPGPGTMDLAVELPPATLRRILEQVGDPALRRRLGTVAATRLLLPEDAARGVARSVALAARAAVPGPVDLVPDPLLERLVVETLFHVSATRRWLAAAIVSLSPYGAAVVDQCLDLASGPDPALAGHAWRALVTLADEHPAERLVTAALAERRRGLQPLALVVLGRSTAPLGEDRLEAVTLVAVHTDQEAVRLAAASVLGRHDPDRLARLLGHSTRADGAVRWWRSLGPALRD